MSEQEQHDSTQEVRKLYTKVDFGIEVENFLGSKVGKYLIHCAEREREEALGMLKEADPFDPNVIRKLQDTVKRAESIQIWMANAIQDGVNAAETLIDLDQ